MCMNNITGYFFVFEVLLSANVRDLWQIRPPFDTSLGNFIDW